MIVHYILGDRISGMSRIDVQHFTIVEIFELPFVFRQTLLMIDKLKIIVYGLLDSSRIWTDHKFVLNIIRNPERKLVLQKRGL